MRKLPCIGHLLADDNFYFESGSPSPTWNPWLSKYLNLRKLIMKLRSLSERDVQATEGGGGFFFFFQY